MFLLCLFAFFLDRIRDYLGSKILERKNERSGMLHITLVKLFSIALVQTVFVHFATCDEYPYTRYFRNSNVTFLSNGMLSKEF